jgi:hypothetical protein
VRNSGFRGYPIPANTAVIAAWTVNELDPETRGGFLKQCLRTARGGSPVLIVEPAARRLLSWWDDWAAEVKSQGGRENLWRFRLALPERLALMDRAAGLDHSELTGRSLWLPGDRATIARHDDVLSKMRTAER